MGYDVCCGPGESMYCILTTLTNKSFIEIILFFSHNSILVVLFGSGECEMGCFWGAVLGLHCGMWASVVAVCGLSCPTAHGILVPQPGIEPTSPALEGGFLTTGPPGRSQESYIF